ncbi:MAG: amino acid permease [Anaerolineales bacterium]|nr:amino acid permease [Anaerolineales bacterium]
MTNAQTAPKKKGLNMSMTTALVMGTMIGSGVFLLPATLAPYGGIALLGWVVTSAGAIMLALVFGSLARMAPASGGPYAYTRMGFEDFTGYLVGWGYWIALWVGNAGITVAMIAYLGFFFPELEANPAFGAGIAIAVVWLLTLVNISGVRNAGIIQLVTTILKLIPLVAVAFFGLFYLNPDYFTPFNASGESPLVAIAATAAMTLWAFLGLESATVPADDVEDAKKTIPRATILGVSLTAVIYILGTISIMGLIPADELAVSTAPYADAAESIWGRGAGAIVALGAVVSTFGALNGWLLLQGQVPLASARDGLFPKVFSHTSKQGTPTTGMVISSILVSILILMNFSKGLVDAFSFIILLATLTALFPYVLCSMAELMLFIKDRERFQGKRLLGSVMIASLAFAFSIFCIWGSGAETVLWGFILLLLGVPVYVWLRWQQAKEVDAQTPT